jgi:sortase A
VHPRDNFDFGPSRVPSGRTDQGVFIVMEYAREYARPYARQRGSGHVPRRIFVRVLQHICLVAGLLALGYVGFVIVQAHIYQSAKVREIEQPREIAQPMSTTPMPPPPIGAAIAEIEIPRVGLHAAVVQGDSDKILRLAVGHMPQTALPGESGNMVFAGHRDTFFRALRSVQKGDRIMVNTPGGSYDYEVESTSIVQPTDLSVLRSVNGRRELTLVTCYPFSWIGSAPQRFVVQASTGQAATGETETGQQLKSGDGAPPLESAQGGLGAPGKLGEQSEASAPLQRQITTASKESHQASSQIPLREDGHTELALAQQYLRGTGVSEDRAMAADLLWAAVGKGNTQAEVQLASLYLVGDDGAGKNCEQARVLLRAASNSGNAVAVEKLAALPGYGCN